MPKKSMKNKFDGLNTDPIHNEVMPKPEDPKPIKPVKTYTPETPSQIFKLTCTRCKARFASDTPNPKPKRCPHCK